MHDLVGVKSDAARDLLGLEHVAVDRELPVWLDLHG
jgi:hypothetical protein